MTKRILKTVLTIALSVGGLVFMIGGVITRMPNLTLMGYLIGLLAVALIARFEK